MIKEGEFWWYKSIQKERESRVFVYRKLPSGRFTGCQTGKTHLGLSKTDLQNGLNERGFKALLSPTELGFWNET